MALVSQVGVTPFGYGQVDCPAVFPTQSVLLWLTVACQLWGATLVYFGFDFYLFFGFTTLFLYIGVLASTSEFFVNVRNIIWSIHKIYRLPCRCELEYGLYDKYWWSWKLFFIRGSFSHPFDVHWNDWCKHTERNRVLYGSCTMTNSRVILVNFLLMSEISFGAYIKSTDFHVGVNLNMVCTTNIDEVENFFSLGVPSVIPLMFTGMIDANILKGTGSCTGLVLWQTVEWF